MKTNQQSGISVLQIIVALAVLAVLLGAISAFIGSDESGTSTETQENNAQIDTPLETLTAGRAETLTAPVTDAAEQANTASEAELDGPQNTTQSASVVVTGTFEAYSADKLILARDGTVVLYFHADWCPSCRGLENDLNANLGNLPANTHILKVDYDSETELKKKYEVIRQHTLVIVDADGTEIKKLTGLTNTLEQVLNQL